MVFSSTLFLFIFLPTVLGLYYILYLPVRLNIFPHFFLRSCNTLLLAVSLLFYFWGETWLVFLMITSSAVDYLSGLIITNGWKKSEVPLAVDSSQARSRVQKFGLLFSIGTNLGLLGFFKYFNFFIDSYNAALSSSGIESLLIRDAIQISLPLGISFYTFQSMSYTIDIYRGQIPATRNFLDFACYVTLFPQLVAGPIVRYRDVATQLVSRYIDVELVAAGITRFAFGLAKKVLIANSVSIVADAIFALPPGELSAPTAWLGITCYTLQIYFDFSGYSDMAIGLGMMLGFRFPENFNYPYIAQNIQDFWRRWHISLSSWFRDYLYIPLGGNKLGAVSTYRNLFTVFFLCGLWHGASWTFVAWGMYHGLFLVVERLGLGRILNRLPRIFRHVYALVIVMVGWVLFRAENFDQALRFTMAMFTVGTPVPDLHPMVSFIQLDILTAIIAGIFLSAPLVPAVVRYKEKWIASTEGPSGNAIELVWQASRYACVMLLLCASVVWLGSGTHNPFIYFRF